LPDDATIEIALQAGVSHGELASSWETRSLRDKIYADIAAYQDELRDTAAMMSSSDKPSCSNTPPEQSSKPQSESDFGGATSLTTGQEADPPSTSPKHQPLSAPESSQETTSLREPEQPTSPQPELSPAPPVDETSATIAVAHFAPPPPPSE
jgi:FtsZ-interacting cell division protein ZipA